MKINVKGVICSNDDQWIYDMFEMDSTSPKDISSAIENANNEDLEVIINSGGGNVHTASEIYTELRSYEGNVHTKIVGLGASAASVIAMAGDKVSMSPTAELMIHNSSTIALGDYREMDQASEMLKVTNQTICNAYRLKTGLSEEEILDLMGKETWLSAQKAQEKGFVDEIMFNDPNIKLSASINTTSVIPQAVIDGLRNGLADKKKSEGITQEQLDNGLEALKKDILNEIKQNNEPPEQKPTSNMSKLFLI